MNRLEDLFKERPPEPTGDFWVVRGPCGWYQVTCETARDLSRSLDLADVPTWLSFVDAVGSRVRIRSKDVVAIFESTAAQRSSQRALDRLLEAEEKAERRPWED